MDCDHYVWESPARELAILLNLRLVDRLQQLIREAPEREIGGYLLGNCDEPRRSSGSRVVVVEDFEPFPARGGEGPAYVLNPHDLKGLLRSLARARSKRGNVPVGFFRSHLRKGLYLDQADFSLFQEHFSGPCDVFLLGRPDESGTPVAGFFFWEDGLLNRRNSYVTFPLDRAKLASAGNALVAAHAVAPSEKSVKPKRTVVVVAAKKWAYGAAGAVMILTALTMAAVMRLSGTVTSERSRDIALSVQPDGSALRLNWNAAAPVVARANSAILWVSDGGQQRRLDLSGKLLKQGSFVYNPRSKDVSFRLDLLNVTEQGSESVSYVGDKFHEAAAAPPPQATAPAPPPPQRVVNGDEADRVIPRTQHKPAVAPAQTKTMASEVMPPAVKQAAPPLPVPSAPVQKPVSQPVRQIEAVPPPKPRAEPTVSITAEAIAPHRRTDWLKKAIHWKRDKDSDFVPPRASHQITPHVPPRIAREMPPDTLIEIKVSIDRNGAVDDIQFMSRSDPRLADLVSAAVSQWHFEPAQFKDKPVASDLLLIMHMHNPGDNAVAQRH